MDERRMVGIFRSRLGCRGKPEDAELVRLGQGVVMAVDTLTEGSDMPPGYEPRDMAWKAAASCASDLAAKGVRPRYGLASVTLPRGSTEGTVRGLAGGLADAAKKFGFRFVGGDTGEGAELSLSIFLAAPAGRIIPRGGARAGDLIFVTGPFGLPSAGLSIIMRGSSAGRGFAARAMRAQLRPEPRIGFGAAAARLVTSCMDSSDGLSTTLHEMARQSGTRHILDRLPAGAGVMGFAGQNGLDGERLVLDGGEEFELVFTVHPRNRKKIERTARRLNVPVEEIGRVERGRGVGLVSGGRTRRIGDGGWRHLSGQSFLNPKRPGRRCPVRKRLAAGRRQKGPRKRPTQNSQKGRARQKPTQNSQKERARQKPPENSRQGRPSRMPAGRQSPSRQTRSWG